MPIDVYGRNRHSIQRSKHARQEIVRVVVGCVALVLIWLAWPAVRNFAFQQSDDRKRADTATPASVVIEEPRQPKRHSNNHPTLTDINIAVLPDTPAAAADQILQFADPEIAVAHLDTPEDGVSSAQGPQQSRTDADFTGRARAGAFGGAAGAFGGGAGGAGGFGGGSAAATSATQTPQEIRAENENDTSGGDALASSDQHENAQGKNDDGSDRDNATTSAQASGDGGSTGTTSTGKQVATAKPRDDSQSAEPAGTSEAKPPSVSNATADARPSTEAASSPTQAVAAPQPQAPTTSQEPPSPAAGGTAASLTEAVAQVPEPSLLLLSGLGIAALFRRRRSQRM